MALVEISSGFFLSNAAAFTCLATLFNLLFNDLWRSFSAVKRVLRSRGSRSALHLVRRRWLLLSLTVAEPASEVVTQDGGLLGSLVTLRDLYIAWSIRDLCLLRLAWILVALHQILLAALLSRS